MVEFYESDPNPLQKSSLQLPLRHGFESATITAALSFLSLLIDMVFCSSYFHQGHPAMLPMVPGLPWWTTASWWIPNVRLAGSQTLRIEGWPSNSSMKSWASWDIRPHRWGEAEKPCGKPASQRRLYSWAFDNIISGNIAMVIFILPKITQRQTNITMENHNFSWENPL